MVSAPSVAGAFRLLRVRHQSADGAIVVGEQLDESGCATKRVTLQIPGKLLRRGRPFHPAQTLNVRGKPKTWTNPRTGDAENQLYVQEWNEIRPRGAVWIDYVAASPAFKGIGRTTAARIWTAFGVELFDLLAKRDWNAIVQGVAGLTNEQARGIIDAWAGSGQERLVEWLDRYRLPQRLSNALLRAYEDQEGVIAKLEADPYRLIAFGASWRVVDEIARHSFGLSRDDPRRLHAGVVQTLLSLYDRGHTAAARETLQSSLRTQTGLTEKEAEEALKLVFSDGGFVRSADNLYQLRGVYVMERDIAAELARRVAAGRQESLDFGRGAVIDAFECESSKGISLADRQRVAVLQALQLPLSMIVGGGGTGKTACLEALHYAVESELGRKDGILQMALAGRAAKRMREATGREAVTIAGFLRSVPDDRIAAATHVVIDEASMLDVPSLYAILRRLKGRAQIVLVGDDFQLPPIGAGKILHILVQRGDLPVTTLDRVWRQEAGNSILTVATGMRERAISPLPGFHGPADGVYVADPGLDVTATALRIYDELGGAQNPEDICILTPFRQRGDKSAIAINKAIHDAHHAKGEPVMGEAGDLGFKVGDRFVCDVNFWGVDLLNGSLGQIIRKATPQEIEDAADATAASNAPGNPSGRPAALVEVDGEQKLLDDVHLLSCSWGYALTCHRAQGSDFKRVIVVLDDQSDRSWLYTAVTRARSQAVLIGTQAQVAKIVATPPRVDERIVALDVLLERKIQQNLG